MPSFRFFGRRYIATLLLSITLPLSAFAESNPEDEKLQFIHQQFQQHKGYSQLWQHGWLGVFSTSAIVNGVLWSESSSRKEKAGARVGFITSTLGVGDILLGPSLTHIYAKKMNQQEVSLPQAEEWLAKAAEKEQYQRSFTNHFLSGLVAVVSGVVIANDDYHKTSDGILTFATNFLASEAKIWTAPTHMIQAWNAYQNGQYEVANQVRHYAKDAPRWQLAAAGPVLFVQYQF